MQQFPAPPAMPAPIGTVMIFNEVVLPVLAILLAAFLGWLGFRVWMRHLERRRAVPEEIEVLRAELDQLRGQRSVMEDLTVRLGEMEERLDFAERLLTKEREYRARLERGDT